MKPAGVAVVIPHFNDVARLRRCLAALTADPEATDIEIVVADNGSDIDLSETVADFPGVRIVVETTRGAAAVRNRGAAETGAEMIFFLDCDCVPEPDWLSAGRAALSNAEIVGGSVEVFDETPPPRSGAEAFETVMAFDQRRYIEEEGFSVSANLLVWRSIFNAVGGFSQNVSEDIEWCWRARDLGYRLIYAPNVRVKHPTRSDFHALVRKFYRINREMFALRRKRPGARLIWGLRAVAMLVSPIAHAPRFLTDPRLASPGERLRGTLTLFRLRAMRAGWMMCDALLPG